MSVQATPLDLRQVYQWALEINGFTASFFSECDMPNPEIESVSFDGAGTVHAINNPGRVKFNPITAKKGLWLGGADAKAWSWLQRAVDWNTGKTSAPSKVKQDVDLLHLDGSGATVETFTLKGAWCSKVETDKLTGKSDFMYETLTIVYDRPERS